ncbi:MAG: SLC13 family permease [Aquificaceae bacterium]|nr:SLC13 family permease [Aquificaceae bacterium]
MDLFLRLRGVDWKRVFFILLGLFVFLGVYFSPPWPDAVDPLGNRFELSREGKGAIALFLLASIWWITEVIPIGVTSIAIGVLQVLFLIRPAKEAFRDFMDPAVMFIFGSIVLGIAFTKTGLTRRIAYKMLELVGERISLILLGCILLTAGLSHFMAHTAASATVFPILLAIHALYAEGEKRTRFGKAVFISMAYSAGAGSIVTFLGAARTPAAVSMFKEFTGKEIGFFELTAFMLPVGWVMVFIIWLYFLLVLKPEKERLPGLREKIKTLSREAGPLSMQEKFVLLTLLGIVTLMALQSFLPQLKPIDRSAIILTGTLLFFLLRILTVKELEEIPWNIILLFSGAMSLGFCLWKTGGAQWIAIKWLSLFQDAHWLVFLLSVAFLVLLLTNFIMNVAAIAITLPITLVVASYLDIKPELILYASLVTSGMPFLLLIGAAPNAIAYGSNQFTPGEFFRHGLFMSVVLLVVLTFALVFLWPALL